MSYPAMGGKVGWAPQAARGTIALDSAFVFHRARDASASLRQLQKTFDPEVGGNFLPGGAFKAGYWVEGTLSVLPRLDNSIVWLLFAFAGNLATTASGNLHKHSIPGRVDAIASDKWLSLRRSIPGPTVLGENYIDCRPMSLAITVNPSDLLQFDMQVRGLKAGNYVDDPTGEGWTPTYEDYKSVPIATKGHFEVPDGTVLDTATNLNINIQTGAPAAEREMVVASYTPHDITMLSRNITLGATLFWKNPTLYKYLYTNGTATWSPVPWEASVDLELESPGAVWGADVAKLGFTAQKVIWEAEQVRLVGGETVQLRVTGTVVQGDMVNPDWALYVINDTASYTWPTGDAVAPLLVTGASTTEVGNVSASIVIAQFDESITSPSSLYNVGFTVNVNAAPATILGGYKYASNKIALVLSAAVVNGDTVTLDYTSTTGDIQDLAGNALVTFSGSAVDNNVPA